MAEYVKPGWAVKNIVNRGLGFAVRLGLSPAGGQLLTVKGRKSGEPMTTPVNPLTVDGRRYLVSPRGDTHWSRNLRAGGEGSLSKGRKSETFRVTEVAEADKPALIAAYLERWGNVTRSHFGTVKDPDQPELERLAKRTPVFRIE